jgi:hypothetical protein
MTPQARSRTTAPAAAHIATRLNRAHPPAGAVARVHGLLRWPLPALSGWLACAVLWLALESRGWSPLAAWAAGVILGLVLTLILIERGHSRVRVLVMAAGFPLAGIVHVAAHRGVPAWLWLAPLSALALIYPLRTWRDAPLYPTEFAALDSLTELLPLASGVRVLDADCGLGNGLEALRRVWPLARLQGVDWSRPVAWLARLRCPSAEIRRGDMWGESWAGLDVVYLFQRPETMARALAKARAEMAAGSWLISLEFEAVDALPYARLHTPRGKPIWIYRLPARGARPTLATSNGRAAGRIEPATAA